jgi:thiamine-monophosphate kinase
MGAMPYWAMLALTLPNVDHEWLSAFAKGFFDLAQEYNVSLIGGDTTRGPSLVMTVTIMGEVPAGAALRRSGAKAGNDVWVSGNVGDAALAVAHRNGKLVLEESDYHEALMRLYEPTPRVALGQALRGIATAAIDISDGLLADLGHICRLSGVGATVDLNQIPFSAIGATHFASDAGRTAIVAGGDDYELCFTAAPNSRESIQELSDVLGMPITRIGQVKRGKGVSLLGSDGKPVQIDGRGYDHFKGA